MGRIIRYIMEQKNETTNQSSVHLFFWFSLGTLSIVKMHLISGRFRRLKLIIKSRETWLCRMIPPYPIGSMVLVYMLTWLSWLGYIDGIHVTINMAYKWILWVLKHVFLLRARIEILWPSLVSELQLVASWRRWLGAFTSGGFKELIMFGGWKHASNQPNMEIKE